MIAIAIVSAIRASMAQGGMPVQGAAPAGLGRQPDRAATAARARRGNETWIQPGQKAGL
jgi:hypothetical protein